MGMVGQAIQGGVGHHRIWEQRDPVLRGAVPQRGTVPGAVFAIQTFGDFWGFHPHCHVLCTGRAAVFMGRVSFGWRPVCGSRIRWIHLLPIRSHEAPRILGSFFLTPNSLFRILTLPKSEFLVRQAKLGESSWLRSQPDKVNRPSEPSFAFMRVTVWVKRKQGDSRA